jgi:hypothetical protein
VRADSRRTDLQKRLARRFPNVQVKRIDVLNADVPEKPLTLEAEVSMKAPGPQGGAAMRLIPVSFLLPTRAPTLPAGPRLTPILVEESFREIEETTVAIPAGWNLTSALPAAAVDGPAGSYRLESKRDGDTLTLVRELTLRAGPVDVGDFEALKRFLDEVARADAGTLILEKLPAGGP